MKKLGSLIGSVVAVVALMAAPPVFSEDESIEDLVSSAATAEDHEAIASWYEEQADEASGRAKLHARLAKNYSHPMGKTTLNRTGMERHCDKLAQSYREEADIYSKMAAEHHEAAKSGE